MVILLDRREMLRRLKAVLDEPTVVQRFYPSLLKYAGRELEPEGVDMLLALAMYDYCKDLPEPVQTALRLYGPRFRKALTG